jgi:hypothetical protein
METESNYDRLVYARSDLSFEECSSFNHFFLGYVAAGVDAETWDEALQAAKRYATIRRASSEKEVLV